MVNRTAFTMIAWSVFFLPPQYLPIYGGGGGNSYTRSCGAGKVLTGFTYRSGMLIDAIGVQCRPVLSNGSLGPQSTGTLVGGSGGTTATRSCAADRVVTSLKIYYGSWINEIRITCRLWNPSTRKFGGTETYASVGPQSLPDHTSTETCESDTQPGNGIRGRAANAVDAIGMICDEP
jgi:hypothetical protein